MVNKMKKINAMTGNLTSAEREAMEKQETDFHNALSEIEAPSWLSPDLQEKFEWYARQYDDLNLLTILDASMLARYVTFEARFIALEEEIQEQPFTSNGGKINPLIVEQRQIHDKMERIETKLGMNPTDRLRFVKHTPVEQVDELEEFISELL